MPRTEVTFPLQEPFPRAEGDRPSRHLTEDPFLVRHNAHPATQSAFRKRAPKGRTRQPKPVKE